MAGRLFHTLPAMSYTIGLATTFHDPAIAIVDPGGEVLFAEAAERYLQYKRAPNCEPDTAARMESLVRRYIPKGAQIRLATSWGEEFTGFLDQMSRGGAFRLDALLKLSPAFNRSLVPECSERALIANLHHQQQRAGIGTLLGLDRAFGEARISGMKRYGHHLSHAAYASWSSPFRDAACLVVDGMGETGASAIFARRRATSVFPTPVGPIMMMFFGAISSRSSSGTCCRRQRLRSAIATARFASCWPTM